MLCNVCGVYIPPNSNAQVWEDIEQSIDLALTCNIDIIVTGDFNVNTWSSNGIPTSDNKIVLGVFRRIRSSNDELCSVTYEGWKIN
jgi:hypothetical protein